ncbi:MAG: UvrB/UvrC motif-containing protein [Gemmataceae bacterium]
MDSLFPRPIFTAFGPTALRPERAAQPSSKVKASRPDRLRIQVKRGCPRVPGIYGMVDRRGELIYVGKAKCLRTRLLSYFRLKSRDPKAGRIIRHTRTLLWEPSPSEFAALLRELELIRCWQPRFNVQGQPRRRRRLYVCLGRSPAPYVYLSSHPAAKNGASFGPVPARDEAREAVRRLNDCFALRDCPQSQKMIFADQKELFPLVRSAGCLRYEIGTCLGPCAGACTKGSYEKRVRAARHFLSGQDESILSSLRSDMATASARQAFERAAALRDKLEALSWLRTQLHRIKHIRQHQSYIYPVCGIDGTELWYVVHGGKVTAALPAPSNDTGRRALKSDVQKRMPRKTSTELSVPLDDLDGLLLVSSWFRRHPEERERLLDLKTLAPMSISPTPITPSPAS